MTLVQETQKQNAAIIARIAHLELSLCQQVEQTVMRTAKAAPSASLADAASDGAPRPSRPSSAPAATSPGLWPGSGGEAAGEAAKGAGSSADPPAAAAKASSQRPAHARKAEHKDPSRRAARFVETFQGQEVYGSENVRTDAADAAAARAAAARLRLLLFGHAILRPRYPAARAEPADASPRVPYVSPPLVVLDCFELCIAGIYVNKL